MQRRKTPEEFTVAAGTCEITYHPKLEEVVVRDIDSSEAVRMDASDFWTAIREMDQLFGRLTAEQAVVRIEQVRQTKIGGRGVQ